LSQIGKASDQAAAHIDDEIINLVENNNLENKNSNSQNDKNTLIKFFDEFFQKFKNIDFNGLEQGYSIGFCLGNFIYNLDSFKKSPGKSNAITLVSLALACGLPLIKIFPKIQSFLSDNLKNTNINLGMILNGLNILYAVTFECISIIRFHYKYKKKWKFTLQYSLKRTIKLGISFSFSILGGLTSKLVDAGVYVFLGISLGPYVTVIIGIVGGIAFGYLGKKVGDKISEQFLGKDEFKLVSSNLYLIYIPLKYRLKGNNPYLSWNKTHLCSKVKSYIIECIINGVDIVMRVINIPNDVFELQECLGYEIDEKQY
jgi:hypothetical protein